MSPASLVSVSSDTSAIGDLRSCTDYREIGLIIADRRFDIYRPRLHYQNAKLIVCDARVILFKEGASISGFYDAELHRVNNRPGVHWADAMNLGISSAVVCGLSLAASLAQFKNCRPSGDF